ncbi:ATP synthase-coupling factor 6, mitochondrial [Chanos chanos]|uniref:ATP synthase peripheral stalk subunit F6, mitochondrial n=1 Tax=Chanos chanos TaxID=29144 RepID=A0A6J2VX43_CHACN|nr:ATP synthase-coupling factor 6, mitochondrial-like [Chanos chanos]
MAASILRVGRLGCLKCFHLESFCILRRAPAANLSTKSSDPKKPPRKTSITQLDPVQKLFLDKIREYSTKSKVSGGPVDVGPEYEKALSEELTKLQRLYGRGGDLTAFPEFHFPEPKLEEASTK